MQNKSFKSRCIVCLMFILGGFLVGLAILATYNLSTDTAFAKQNLIRLHVIANSNLPKDQNLKLDVRDAILCETKSILGDVQNKELAQELLTANQDKIQEVAQAVVYNQGFGYPVNVKIGHFPFPQRSYGDISLPEGYYDAIRIEIGEAVGDNWWCVLFPPLCLADLEGADGDLIKIDEETSQTTTEKGVSLVFKSKLWDHVSEMEYVQKMQQWWKASAASFTYLAE
ncbi:MAG: stage II sporulation protein R [Bacillota bacterium]|nr:stage II sporulation protein R [Bacillota bacterium]HHU62324.1 stage II sporulation protein R [Natronincola sp.]